MALTVNGVEWEPNKEGWPQCKVGTLRCVVSPRPVAGLYTWRVVAARKRQRAQGASMKQEEAARLAFRRAEVMAEQEL